MPRAMALLFPELFNKQSQKWMTQFKAFVEYLYINRNREHDCPLLNSDFTQTDMISIGRIRVVIIISFTEHKS